MDRGGAPCASPGTKRQVSSAKGGIPYGSSKADQGGRAEETSGDEEGDGARRVGDGNDYGQGGEKRERREKGCEERVRGVGYGRGNQDGVTKTRYTGGYDLEEDEDRLGGGIG